jgi:outer membrane protein OmpA-like peptidoglycan-associated protein
MPQQRFFCYSTDVPRVDSRPIGLLTRIHEETMISSRRVVVAAASLLSAVIAAPPPLFADNQQPPANTGKDSNDNDKNTKKNFHKRGQNGNAGKPQNGGQPNNANGAKNGNAGKPQFGAQPKNGKPVGNMPMKKVIPPGKNAGGAVNPALGVAKQPATNVPPGRSPVMNPAVTKLPTAKPPVGQNTIKAPANANNGGTFKGLNWGNTQTGARKPPLSAADARKQFENLRKARTQKVEAGGNIVIKEPGNRTIFKQNNRFVIQHDETERLRRVDPKARFEKGKNGTNIAVINRPGGVRIFSETDANGHLIRRYRRGPDNRDVIIIDNRRRGHGGRDFATGVGIGVGVVAGAVLLDSVLNVPPPRVHIPRNEYIVDYDGASEDAVYDALSAPPVEEYRDRYTLDEIRATAALRDRMRRVDLDDINFEFGSWDVDPSEYGKLERVARAMLRVIKRNPDEVFMIEGYTDAVGSPEDNLSLSDRRAESVAEVLTEQFGVPFENLTTQGYGEDYLKVPTDGPERLNRRVAVRRITPLLARGGGGGPSDADDGGPPDDDSGPPQEHYERGPRGGPDQN